MPELPEAETIGNALRRILIGRRIVKVEVFSPKMREPVAPLLTAGLEGLRITGVVRRARYVSLTLSDGRAILMHFGMSGVVRVEDASVPKRKHEHVFLHLDDGKIFRFECTRRFSLLKVTSGDLPELSGLGVEPLTDGFDGRYLYHALQRSKSKLKLCLMNNAIVAGVGNIYANESLFAAGLRPDRVANTVSEAECERLCRCVKSILRRAIEAGGSSISDFLNVDGSEGKFARELQIYGRAGAKCPVCGATVERCRLGGRSSFFCPKCQK